MPELIDTHCHLADERIRPDLDAILDRAVTAGVAQIVAVGAIGEIATDRETVAIAQRYPWIYAVVGVHPHDAQAADDARIAELEDLIASAKVVGVGETGMDLHYLRSPRQAQERSLRRHLELAERHGLPIVIHCREAEDIIADIVREQGMPGAGGVIHCFTGDKRAAEQFLELGFFLSFSGILTFKNAGALRAVAAVVPEDRLLIETDAPYLTPQPYRGQRNEPGFVTLTLATLAAVRNSNPDYLAQRTAANARALFKLSKPEAA